MRQRRRCIAALVHDRRRLNGEALAHLGLTLDSPGGLIQARVQADGLVSVDMGVPSFDPRSRPSRCPGRHWPTRSRSVGSRSRLAPCRWVIPTRYCGSLRSIALPWNDWGR